MGAGAESEDVAAELVRLREENARLRAPLGLDARLGDGHTVAWSPTLLSSPPDGPVIDRNAPNAAKLELFRARFGARSCVVMPARCWPAISTGGTWVLDALAYLDARHTMVSRRRSSAPGPATVVTSGSSSMRRCPHRRPGHSAPRCRAKPWPRAPRWTCRATTGSSPPRTSSPRPGSGTSSPYPCRAGARVPATRCSSTRRPSGRTRISGRSCRRSLASRRMPSRTSRRPSGRSTRARP